VKHTTLLVFYLVASTIAGYIGSYMSCHLI